ncbi:ribonuclease H-like domain-containing protein [Suillus bovinus]|uniref:ribonuclease H-like domain-containing protein n=1 Tax=Suillus bovinus TaxID=48563 RepID=UPI001B86BA2F|nr:ribonuclease H-like domain-containing protein [Suillus bovinus]KAG2156486.1 ribonuclease H-like domain-containing protein [Suillus bovinus]
MSGTAEGFVKPAVSRPELPRYFWRDQSPAHTRIRYITNHLEADFELSRLAIGPLGFDLEWRPNYRKGGRENPVALVQLAGFDTILLLQISAMSGMSKTSKNKFPLKLREVLLDPLRVKTGVSIQRDCKKLYEDWGVSTHNCVELALLARSVDNARWKGKYTSPLGLSRLLETYVGFSLAKGKVQRSNWELRLSLVQQEYAANDAHAGYAIYTRLIALARDMPNTDPYYYSFSVVNGLVLDHLGSSQWIPHNPYYDPGPPPPPKEPKEKEKNKTPRAPTSSVVSQATTSSGSSLQDRIGMRNDSQGPLLSGVPVTPAVNSRAEAFHRTPRNRPTSTQRPKNRGYDPAQYSVTMRIQ